MNINLFKIICGAFAAITLVACGGGGGGSSATPPAASVSAANAFIKTMNTSYTSTNLTDMLPKGYDYGTVTFSYGNLGSNGSTKPCVIARHILRAVSGSSHTLPDAPMDVFCQNTSGGYSESSVTLFGAQQYINGNYAVVADLDGTGADDIFVVQAWDGDNGVGGTTNATIYHHPATLGGIYTAESIVIQNSTNGGTSNVLQGNVQSVAVNITGHTGSCKDIVHSSGWVLTNNCNGSFSPTVRNLNFTTQPGPDSGTDAGDYGNGICVGDFGSGQQLVITDSFSPRTRANQSNSVITVDKNLNVTNRTVLAAPHWLDNQATGTAQINGTFQQGTNSVQCVTVHNLTDSSYDSIVISELAWLWTSPDNTWNHSFLQVFQSNGGSAFTNVSAATFPNYDTNTQPTFSARFVTLASGKMAVMLDGGSYISAARAGNQIWVRNAGVGTAFAPVFTTELLAVHNAALTQFGGGPNWVYPSQIPVLNAAGTWDYISQVEDNKSAVAGGTGAFHYVYENTGITFN